jgi:hypothetical protein
VSRSASTQPPPATGTPGKPVALPPFFEPPADLSRDGFFLVGTVVGRIRREFHGTDGKPTRYAITLALQTEDGLQRPERWCDSPSPSDVPERGQRIVLPVSVTFYQGKGGTGCRLTWGAASREEEF